MTLPALYIESAALAVQIIHIQGMLMSEHTVQTRNAPRWKTIRDELRREMDQFEYGQSFYSISQVSQRFDVSAITAIRSLTELVNEQLIEKVHGKGHIVRSVRKAVSLRLVISASAQKQYITQDSVVRRLYVGLLRATDIPGVTFETLSEAHLQSLFPRTEDRSGFIIHRNVKSGTLDYLRRNDLPYVLLDPLEQYKNHPYARLDRVQAGYLAAKHLIEQGHRRIGWITGPMTSRNFRQRIIGYRNALREAGIPFRWSYLQESVDPYLEESNHDALKQLLSLRHPPTAIIAGDDNRALHLIASCRTEGISIPGGLSLVGYPNDPEAGLSTPPLTVVDGMYETVAESAVKILLSMVQSKAPADRAQLCLQQSIEPKLVVRGSTARLNPGKSTRKSEGRSRTHFAH